MTFRLSLRRRYSTSLFNQVEKEDMTLLGAPVVRGTAQGAATQQKIEELDRAMKRLSLLHAHYSLVLLKNSLTMPKLLYFSSSEQQTAVAISCWRYLTVRSELAYLNSPKNKTGKLKKSCWYGRIKDGQGCINMNYCCTADKHKHYYTVTAAVVSV